MPKRTGSPMASEESKKTDVKESPKSGSVPPLSVVNENLNPDLPATSPTKAELMEDLAKLKIHVNNLQTEFRDGLLMVSKKPGEFTVTQSAAIQATNFQSDFLEEVNDRCIDSDLRTTTTDRKVDFLEQEVKSNTTCMNNIHREVRQNTQDIKCRNLILNGIPEKKDEIVLDVAMKYLKNIDPAFNKNAIESAYRMGKSDLDRKGNRIMVIRFKIVDVKKELLKKKSAMKNKRSLGKVFYNDDLPDQTPKTIQEMREIAAYAKKISFDDAKVSGQRLYVDGKSYTEEELYLLPERIRLEKIKTRPIGEGIGFQSKYSCLSNFFPCKIVINNKVFTNAEQAFQYYKAVVCERDDVSTKINSNNDPEKVKYHGDKLDTCPEWEERKVAYMKCIASHKFKQNPELRAKLLDTAGMELIECTTNKFWGSGRRFDSL